MFSPTPSSTLLILLNFDVIDDVKGGDPSRRPELCTPLPRMTIMRVITYRRVPLFTQIYSEYKSYSNSHAPYGVELSLDTYLLFSSAISKDPEVFPDPDRFDPERFINPTHPPLIDFDLPFGFGRRICPGQHVALQSIFIVISRFVYPYCPY